MLTWPKFAVDILARFGHTDGMAISHTDEMETGMSISMWETIETLANERVLHAEDYRPFIGHGSWLVMPYSDPREPIVTGIICDFVVDAIDPADDRVWINVEGFGVSAMNADELAIRIEAA